MEILASMLTIGEKPLLEHHVALAAVLNTDIIILVNHLKVLFRITLKMAAAHGVKYLLLEEKNRWER